MVALLADPTWSGSIFANSTNRWSWRGIYWNFNGWIALVAGEEDIDDYHSEVCLRLGMSRVAEIGCEIRQVLASMFTVYTWSGKCQCFFPVFFLLSPHSGHCEFMGAELNGPRYPLNNSVVYPIWLVVWNIFYFSVYWDNNPNWRTPWFFRGVGQHGEPATSHDL